MSTTTAPLPALLLLRDDLQSRQANRDTIAIEHHADPMDDACILAAREAAAGVISSERDLLREVEAAIQRCEEGTFGECEECQGKIAAARLKAVPWARLCIECARAEEEKKHVENTDTAWL